MNQRLVEFGSRSFADGQELGLYLMSLITEVEAMMPGEVLNFEIDGFKVSIMAHTGTERKIFLTNLQKEVYQALINEPSLGESLARKLTSNSSETAVKDQAFDEFNDQRPHSVFYYLTASDKNGVEYLVVLEGTLKDADKINLHNDLRNSPMHQILMDLKLVMRSGHILESPIADERMALLDYWEASTGLIRPYTHTRPGEMQALAIKIAKILILNGFICVGSDGSIALEPMIKKLLAES